MCQDFSFGYVTIAERRFISLGLLLSWVAKLKSAPIKHTCDSLQQPQTAQRASFVLICY